MAKHTIQIIDDDFYEKIIEYCKLNKLKIGQFVTDMLKKQFMVEQYGDIPFGNIDEKDNKKEEVLPQNENKLVFPIINSDNILPQIEENNAFQENELQEQKEEIIKNNLENIQKQIVKPKKRRL